MNPNGNADGAGWANRDGPPIDRRNRWRPDPAIPPPLLMRLFRNDDSYGHPQNSLWPPGRWSVHGCPGHHHSCLPPRPQQVFMQHQPFGNAGQAPAAAFPFPPPVHIPRHFYFGAQRGNMRRHSRRQFSRPSSQDRDVNGSNGAASGNQRFPHGHRDRHSGSRSKGGNGVKGKRKQHWKRRANGGGLSAAGVGKEGKAETEECVNEKEGVRDKSNVSKISCGNGESGVSLDGEVEKPGSLHSSHNAVMNVSLNRRLSSEGGISSFCDTDQSEDDGSTKYVSHSGFVNGEVVCEDDKLEDLGEGGAVGGVGISEHSKFNTGECVCCLLDKDLVDEGAICDFDGLFQNQEYFKNGRGSSCNSEEEQSDSSLCYREPRTSVPSEDSESENGAYGGLSSSTHFTKYSFLNGLGAERPRDKISSLNGCRNGDSLGRSRLLSNGSNGEVMRSGQRNDGAVNANISDSGGEDNGDFIDADLPSCNNHILSSSDEMENLSSDDESGREDNRSKQSVFPHKLSSNSCSDYNCNDLSTVQNKILNDFEHLSLRRDVGMPCEPSRLPDFDNKCRSMHKANQALGNSNCDSKSGNKSSLYCKQARYLSENSDSDCENCDIVHTNVTASQPSPPTPQTTLYPINPAAATHLPVIGAAASTSTLLRGEKEPQPDHPGADCESLTCTPQPQCFHPDISSSGICNLPSGKAVEPCHHHNPALSASSEQFSHHRLLTLPDPAVDPSFMADSACCSHVHCPNPVNDLSPSCHLSTGPSANVFSDGTGANFVMDERNQHQKVFSKKSMEEKEVSDTSCSASSVTSTEMGADRNLLEIVNDGEMIGNRCAEELLSPDSGDSVDMVLLPMEEDIEPVHIMAGFCPSSGPGSGDEEDGRLSPSVHLSASLTSNVQAGGSAYSYDDCHCACKDSTPKLSNRLPSKEFYELIKSVSASDSYMRFFDKDGKDVQRSSLNSHSDEESVEQYSRQSCSKADRLKVDRVMIWNEYEAYVVQFKQIAVSACGQTAVLNVMKALKFNCDKAAVCKVIKTSLRKEDKDIPEYLFSRACAGTTATELMEGVEKLSGGSVGGRFFHFWPPRKVKLLHWLAFWMKRGAIPMATMNLQQGPHSMWEVPDSWHHQMVYGVSHQGLYLTNPLEIVSERSAMKQLCSDSILLVRRQDIVSRFQDNTDLSQLLEHPDPRWMSMNVLGQVVNVLRECNMPSVPGYRLQVTSHIAIPACYQAGIMLFMRKDKGAWKTLMTAPDLPLEESLSL